MSSDGNRGDQDDDADQTMRNAPIRVQEISLDIFLHCTIRSWYQFLLQCGCGWCCQCEFVGRRRGRNNGQQWIAMAADFGALRTSEGQTQTHMKRMCVSYAPNPTLATLHSHKMSALVLSKSGRWSRATHS